MATTSKGILASTASSTVPIEGSVRDWPGLPTEYCEPHWYAVHTSANHEKRVVEQLGARGVEHFLPLYSSVRHWKDRRVTLQLPLFPGYVFVHMALRERLRVLQLPGVARLIGFNGTPTPLPQTEMDALRASLEGGAHAEPHPFLTVGQKVRVKGGPLRGTQGILMRRKNQFRFVLSLHLIMRSVAVELDHVDLEPLD